MTAATMNTQTAPTPEALQEALEFLKVLSEQKSSPDNDGKQEPNTAGSDILKTIEAALKICSDAKAASTQDEDEQEEDDGKARRKRHAVRTADPDLDEEEESDDEEDEDSEADDEDEEDDEDEDDDGDEEDDNPFDGDYYWSPGPEWKAIGLVAGGAALVGLGALLYKLFDD